MPLSLAASQDPITQIAYSLQRPIKVSVVAPKNDFGRNADAYPRGPSFSWVSSEFFKLFALLKFILGQAAAASCLLARPYCHRPWHPNRVLKNLPNLPRGLSIKGPG